MPERHANAERSTRNADAERPLQADRERRDPIIGRSSSGSVA